MIEFIETMTNKFNEKNSFEDVVELAKSIHETLTALKMQAYGLSADGSGIF